MFLKIMIITRIRLHQEGTYRDRHGRWMRDAVDVRMLSARDARRRKHSLRTSEIVRSRRPDAGVNLRVTSPGGRRLKARYSGETTYKP